MNAVRQSASHWSTPNDSIGYGIPDLLLAHELLTATVGVEERISGVVDLFPVPFQDNLTVRAQELEGRQVQVRLLDLGGRMVHQESRVVPVSGLFGIDTGLLPSGVYLVELRGETGRSIARAVKQ
jgi:hypothetical protein